MNTHVIIARNDLGGIIFVSKAMVIYVFLIMQALSGNTPIFGNCCSLSTRDAANPYSMPVSQDSECKQEQIL